MELEFSQHIFKKCSNINFNENPSSGIRADPYGQKNMTKLTVGSRNFTKTPKTGFAILHAPTIKTVLYFG